MAEAERELATEEERSFSLGIERVSYEPGLLRGIYGKPFAAVAPKLEKLRCINDELERLRGLYPAVRARRYRTLYITDASQGWSGTIVPPHGPVDLSAPNPLP